MPRLLAATAIAVLALASGCHPRATAALSASDAWVRLAAVPGRPAAAYFTIQGGAQPDRLVRVTSPAAATIELHESMAGGMRPIAGADVRAGGTLAFAPGGRHAMLFGLSPKVAPGGAIELRFTMASGRTIDGEAEAIAAGDPAPAGSH